MDDNKSTFNTTGENPFLKVVNESSFGNTAVGENPFFSSLSKPVAVSSGKGFNIFGKPQDSTIIIGSTVNTQVDNQPIFDTKVSIMENPGAKNPFLSDFNLQKNPLSSSDIVQTNTQSDNLPILDAKVSVMEDPGAGNPFFSDTNLQKTTLSSATGNVNANTKLDDTLPNPFLDNSVPVTSNTPSLFSVTSAQQVDVVKNPTKSDGNSDGIGLFPQSTYSNPFMSTVPLAPMFSNIATIPSQGFGIKGRNSPCFTSVAPSESKTNMNIFSRGGPIPGKVEDKKKRSSLDGLKPALSLLANNLKAVIATDSESKYDVLEKIDKAIRKGVKSNFHIQDGKRYRALKGTCMDMCPEKERYFRDDKHQISPFELSTVQDIVSTLDGDYPQLDHHKAVKEYSRSSADQEEPLPHQLRPASVLNYTMGYLVMNIMDVKYSKRTDWFDFLWNRTRAIRKDITQQNLSCMETISIIEKCARFHIYCTHYLCEHELHVFDPKLNLENLTKCLQTLKHMYEDQWKENKEVNCNESEFRCYQILLNLNDGDMLREVMHFRKDIRESIPVKFALKIFSAVHDNNYVRFFKLVKSASYLNACLLQPYFTQIRDLALTTMVRTFSQPNSDVPYSLANLQKILAFNNTDETVEFCQKYGLSTYECDVYFNRSSFSKPEEPFHQKMSNVISEKLQLSMSEIVNNGPLVLNLDIQPVNSFTDEGTYVGNYHMLDDDTFNESVIEEVKCEKVVDVIEVQDDTFVNPVTSIASETIFVEDDDIPEVIDEGGEDNIKINDSVDQDTEDLRGDIKSHADDPDYVASEDVNGEDTYDDDDYSGNSEYSDDEEEVMFLREDYIAYLDELLSEEISEYIESLSCDTIDEAKDEMSQSEVMTDQELAIMCIEQTRMAVAEVIDEEQVKLEKEKQQMIEDESTECNDHLIDESVMSVLSSICLDVYQDEIDVLEANVLTDEIEKQSDTVLSITLNQEMTQIASDVITETSLNRAKRLESNRQSILKKKLSVMFNRWIKAYKQQQFIKSSLIDFPPLPPLITTKEAVQKLHPDGDISYSLPNFTDKVKKIIQPKINKEDMTTNISVDINEEKFSKPLSSIIEDGMSLLFFKKFHEHCLYCESLLLPVAQPNDIIRYYNNTLSAIRDGIELNFNEKGKKQLHKLISVLELPFITEIDLYNWDLCCSECEEFVSKVANQNCSVLLSRINNILDRYISRTSENEDISFPWSEILEACIFNKMSTMYLEKSDVDSISFQSVVSCEPAFISSIRVVNPLKEHIKLKRTEDFALQNSLTYKDEMKRRKFTREYKLRKSLDSVDSELDKLESSFLRKSKSMTRERSSSLHDLLNHSTLFLEDVEFVKQNCLYNRRSFPSSCSDVNVMKKEESLPLEQFRYDRQTGCKRTFENSMMECLKDIDDYRIKLKTREDYWREIIDQ